MERDEEFNIEAALLFAEGVVRDWGTLLSEQLLFESRPGERLHETADPGAIRAVIVGVVDEVDLSE
jgi:hypothetical protein